jgi:hypothetical protein
MEGAPAHGIVAHLLPPKYKRMVAEWLEEDTPSLDYGGFVVGEDVAEAKLLGKSKVCIHIGVTFSCFWTIPVLILLVSMPLPMLARSGQ